MASIRKALIVGFTLAFLPSCTERGAAVQDYKDIYMVCLTNAQNPEMLKSRLSRFALVRQMKVYDRSHEVELELSALPDADFLIERTAGPIVLMTAERRKVLRISITNVGLRRSALLTFKYYKLPRDNDVEDSLKYLNDYFYVSKSQNEKDCFKWASRFGAESKSVKSCAANGVGQLCQS